MIELIATNDSRAMRNKNNVLALYDLMINQKAVRRGYREIRQPIIHPAQPSDSGRLCRAGPLLRQNYQ
jgi:hypothetical protein